MQGSSVKWRHGTARQGKTTIWPAHTRLFTVDQATLHGNTTTMVVGSSAILVPLCDKYHRVPQQRGEKHPRAFSTEPAIFSE